MNKVIGNMIEIYLLEEQNTCSFINGAVAALWNNQEGLHKLSLLNMECCPITRTCLNSLTDVVALLYLNVSRSNLTDDGCEYFSMFDNMLERDSKMICGLANHGKAPEAIHLFQEMQRQLITGIDTGGLAMMKELKKMLERHSLQ
ncbi:hypothetical protein L1987_30654 [Smallanthus sonchifolius]|uniref:Uncharacterized protein n=1 Tax=Smallanthus sonchifolius TaxID=185202 RepID=A0ACB9I437_9ASTR|nr:hypothetical protein L1987_30654 [Smallanthus sonchifolius]